MSGCEEQWCPSPLKQLRISSLFQISPLFPTIFQTDAVENFSNSTFSEKNSRFSSTQISDDCFLVIDSKFWISSVFLLFQYISPLF